MTKKNDVVKAKKKINFTEEKPFEFLRVIVSILISLLITFILLCFVTKNPVGTFFQLLTYPLRGIEKGNFFFFGYVLAKMVPLCFAGLATLLYFRTGLFNLSTEGVFYFSGVFATFLAINGSIMTGNDILDSAICILGAGLVGGLIALIPGYLKAKLNADEMVISLMLNNILFGIGYWIVLNFLAIDGITGTASADFLESALLGKLVEGTQIHTGLIIVIVAVVAVYVLLFKTKLGYSINITGLNKNFARYSGMSAFGLFMIVHFIAGFVGGVGSGVELMGMYKNFQWSVLPGLGFTGALMANIGKNHPIGVLLAAFGISYLRAGAQLLANSNPAIDINMIAIVEVVLTLLISSQYFLRKWRERQMLKEEQKNA